MDKKAQDTAPYVTQLRPELADRLLQGLEERGFTISKPAYTRFCGKKSGVTCFLYESGKLVVQGRNKKDFIEFFLEPEILHTFQYQNEEVELDCTGRIGIDESGKGDVFGPLCIAGVYAEGDTVKQLLQLGVRDSKKIGDAEIAVIAKKIRGLCRHHIVRLGPLKYNQLYRDFRNLNHLLAWGHATAIEQLVKETDCHRVVIDQFAAEEVVEKALKRKGLQVDLTQRHRAESDLVVAAASILARHAFLEGLERLSAECGVVLPKGATHGMQVTLQQLMARHGKEIFEKVAKVHFKTIQNYTFP